MSKHESEVLFKIVLDENKIPEKITWQATDAGMDQEEAGHAVFISVFEPQTSSALRMDLWIKDFPADEMKKFFFQIYQGMADTFERAIGDEEMAQDMRDFARYFGERQQVIKAKK
jgi:gliding motility-associated protein GldC